MGDHQLLYWTSEHLSRVKKIVNITMRLGLVNKIWFKLWEEVGKLDNLEMVPQDLFNKHFGRYNVTNPHGIKIEYDLTYRPSTDEEKSKVVEWDHPIQYDLEKEHENQAWEDLFSCQQDL